MSVCVNVDLNDKLKPCPFCDETNTLVIQHGRDWSRIFCIECGCTMDQCRDKYESIDELLDKVIERWNTRKH